MLEWTGDLTVRRATFVALLRLRYPMVTERTIHAMLCRKIKPISEAGKYSSFGREQWQAACDWIESRNRAYQIALENSRLMTNQNQ